MKAIIMAGGEGSRLRPLTCDRPKPLTSVMNRPVMEHIIQLLKKHGIHEIGVTLQYLPDAIRDHFGDGRDWGVHLEYFVEDSPLGTAGSVKNAEDFLDDTFLVISGDALTDFDLSKVIKYHHEQQAIATLVLTSVESPLEYGVVITDQAGRITQFLEKPSWGEVFSDKVNTGIYVLEPEVLKYFERNQKFDFSQDLFPMLLQQDQPMHGFVLPGYWCDIGNLQQYAQAHLDVLNGKVQMDIPGVQIAPGVWVESGVELHPEVQIVPPVYLGANVKAERGAILGPHTVVGDNCIIEDQATIKRSMLWDNVRVGSKSELRGTVLGNRVNVKSLVKIFEGAVIGDDCILKERSMIKPNIKVWPGKAIEQGAVVSASLIWGTRTTKSVFGLDGAGGLVNQELTPEFCSKIGSALGSTLPIGAALAVSCDPWPAARMLKQSLIAGLMAAGIRVIDLGQVPIPVSRQAVGKLEASGGVHVKRCGYQGDHTAINILNSHGANCSKAMERKIENLLAREDFRRVDGSQVNAPVDLPSLTESYLNHLLAVVEPSVFDHKLKLLLAYPQTSMDSIVPSLFAALNLEVEYLEQDQLSRGWNREDLEYFREMVQKKQVDIGAFIDNTGERLILVDENGKLVSEDLLTALVSLVILKSRPGETITVPITAPQAIDLLAERYQGKVIRTKTALQVIMEKMLTGHDEHEQEGALAQFFMNFDALYALVKILEHMARDKQSLAQTLEDIPNFYMSKKAIECPWEAKGKVMRHLIEEQQGQAVELVDGVKVFHEDGWALVLPDSEEPICRVFSESHNMEIAESLTDLYVEKIKQIQSC